MKTMGELFFNYIKRPTDFSYQTQIQTLIGTEIETQVQTVIKLLDSGSNIVGVLNLDSKSESDLDFVLRLIT